jgi:hypothetical protein
MPNFLQQEKNIIYFCFFAIIWAIFFVVQYYFFNGIPRFISNDSFQYLSIAKDIYRDQKSTGLINYALDLYYDELALFNYDFNNLKPYHFPSYSAFLSLFYFIYNNDNFVIYASQYLSFLIFSISSFLVINNYQKKSTAFFLTVICFCCSPIILYISDSGKEILCSGLAMLGIYLGLYYKKRNNLRIIFTLCLIFTFLSITRNFYLLLALLIFIYRAIPTKYKADDIKETLKTKSIFFFFVFLIPLMAYIYCYYFIEIHLFIFDNKTNIYGGRNLDDLIIRIMNNLLLGVFVFFVQYIQYLLDKFHFNTSTSLFYSYQTFGFTIIGFYFYFKTELKNIFINKNIKISKLLIINLFYLTLFLVIIIRFSLLGYRLTIGYLPIAFIIIYQTFSFKNLLKKSQFSANISSKFLVFFLFVNFFYNIKFSENNIPVIAKSEEINNYVKNKIDATKSKKVVAEITYFNQSHHMPLLHKFPSDVYFLSHWQYEKKNLCEDLSNYHEHKIDFDIIFTRTEYHEKNCEFINNNFYLEEKNEYGLVYLKKPSNLIKRLQK